MAVSATVIFCDDIRFEMSGKMLLVGVYPEDLVPSVMPQTLVLSFWVRLKGVSAGTHNLRFAVGANGTDQVEAGLPLVVQEGKELSHLTLVGLPVELKDYGSIHLTLSGFPGGEAVRAELPVVQARAPEGEAVAS